MGYKRIGSAVHNFAHSFVSLMNYRQGGYVIDVLGDIVPRLPGGEVRIEFPGGRIEPRGEYPGPLRESVASYDLWWPRLLESEGVSPGMVSRLQFIATFTGNGLEYRAFAIDDRKRLYLVDVLPG